MLAAPKDPLRLSPQLLAPSGQVLEAVRKLGLEGVVGKRIGSTYEPGERSGAWIKLRANMEEEFVIGGYIPGARGFDALLVGVYEKKELIFSAKVKSGFVPRLRDEIFLALKKLQIARCPFTGNQENELSELPHQVIAHINSSMDYATAGQLSIGASTFPRKILDPFVGRERQAAGGCPLAY
jgi:ATP-dependent DNA ligase